MPISRKDVAAGVVFGILGIALGSYTLLTMDFGTALRMGPGFFPLVLSGLLIIIGLGTAYSSLGATASPIGGIPWRGVILVLSAPIVFGATLRGLGFVPATVATVALAVLASPGMKLRPALFITLGLTVFCFFVFVVGLRVPVRLLGPWLGN